jgi:hypothetical protein
MPGIMADNDVQVQFQGVLRLFLSPTWRDLWESLGFTVETFESLGLHREDPDALVWQRCQERGVVLFTGNRKSEAPDSLEATIRMYNKVDSLPVVTLSDAKRFGYDQKYREDVAEALMDILLDLDNRRGAGRLFVPKGGNPMPEVLP